MPARSTLMGSLANRFEELRKKLIQLLKEQKHVCITADVWSSRAQSYLGVTAHYITPSFERKSFLLAFRSMKSRQTNEVLAAAIDSILKEFNLGNHKVTHILTDGGAAFCKAFKKFGRSHDVYVECIPEEDILQTNERNMPFIQNEDGELLVNNVISFDGTTLSLEDSDVDENSPEEDFTPNEIENSDDILQGLLQGGSEFTEESEQNNIQLPPQRRCMSHQLNLISGDFEKALNSQAKTALIGAVSKVHALWNFVHRSCHAKTLCLEVLGCVLPVPCITRWNSRYDSIAKVCEPTIKPKVNSLIQRLSAEIHSAAHLQVLSNADWAVLSEYVRVMEPIAMALDILQGEKKSCQGYITPTLISMRYRITSLEGNGLLQAFKTTALEVIHKRFQRYFRINYIDRDLTLAAVSHPLFKTSYIENTIDERTARDILRDECMKVFNEKQSLVNECDQSSDAESEGHDFFVSFNRTSVRRNSIENDVDSEISRYLADKRKEESLLNDFPIIREIFFKYNTTLSSSAPVERVFSQSNLIFRPQRSRISAENFERALFMKINSELLYT